MGSFFRHLTIIKNGLQFLFTMYQKMSSQTIEIKYNELSKKLVNGLELYVSLI